MNKRKTSGNIFIAVGIIIIIIALAMKLNAYYVQKSMIETFQKNIENVHSSKDAAAAKIEGNVTAVVSIPKISLAAPMSEGTDMETLKYSLGHFKGTADPGNNGNCCIAGHRSYTYSQLFNRLDELKTGDEITIATKKGSYTYIVCDTFVVEPSQTEVLTPAKDAMLTLVTCTPIRSAEHRLIVKAKLK